MSRRPIRPADVVLGLVDPADRAEVGRLLQEDPLFRDEVERLRRTTAQLGQLDRTQWRPEAPPPLGPPPDLQPEPVPQRPRRSRVLLPLAGLAAAAVATAAVVLPSGGSGTATSGHVLALRPLGSTSGRATLTLIGDKAVLRAAGMPPSGPHDFYEAWLADDRGRMVSMGAFRVHADGTASVSMPVAVDVGQYDLVDVSLEPDDGDPAHSATSVMRARL